MCSSERPQAEGASSPPDDEEIAFKAAFGFLYSGLRDAKKVFEASEDAGREGTIRALKTLHSFLRCFQPVLDEDLNAPLAGLINAMLSLKVGTVLPLLKPAPSRGRYRGSGVRNGLKGAAAFTVSRLCKTGQSLPDARKEVARILREGGVTAARGRFPKITDRTVRSWCEEVAADVGRHGEAARSFDQLERESALPPDVEAAYAANARSHYLASLANLIQEIRGADQ